MSRDEQDLYTHTLRFYEDHGADLFQSYNSVASPLAEIIPSFFKKNDKILDIGCGSARDLKMLYDSGYDAWGMEPSAVLIRLAEESFPGLKGRIHQGSLPDDFPSALPGPWEGILCSAVLQHIPDEYIFDCLFLFHHQLMPEGKLFLSVPVRYPVQKDRDGKGRFFKVRPVEEYDRLLRRMGFVQVYREERADGLGREGIVWGVLVYEKENRDGLAP